MHTGTPTASSIQKVANRTCRTFVFEAIDMPMDTAVEDTITKVRQYLERVNTRKGMILLVDTGSSASCILPSKMTWRETC